MRVPIRKSGKFTNLKPDTYLTKEKFLALKKELAILKKQTRPQAAKETKRLADMGDLSENAAYSIAKGKLRFLNQKIDEMEHQLASVNIIKPINKTIVQVGHTVTIKINNNIKTYKILGSSEIDLKNNVISFKSPLGEALLGHKIGDEINMKSKQQGKKIIILKIE